MSLHQHAVQTQVEGAADHFRLVRLDRHLAADLHALKPALFLLHKTLGRPDEAHQAGPVNRLGKEKCGTGLERAHHRVPVFIAGDHHDRRGLV